ncbi:MAG: hypothetical protein M3O46_12085 [Myxococcota bacterium]|nr:hypothetical protein [Myxococcota bacterium]
MSGDLFPLRGELVTLKECAQSKPGGSCCSLPPAVVLEIEPGGTSPDEVFIPLSGFATLDGDTFVQSRIVRADGSDRPVAGIVGLGHDWATFRIGESFAWSEYHATVVRIVEQYSGDPRGWVGVRLSVPVPTRQRLATECAG